MEYGIIVTAMSLFGTFALVLADVTSEPENPTMSQEPMAEVEQRQAA